MSEVRIAAEPRTEFGKGGARRTRRAGRIPAVLYGHGQDVVHLSLPDQAGHANGFMSAAYLRAVRRSDRLLGRILSTVRSRPALRKHTVVALTTDHGGSGATHADARRVANYRVPFLVWGPGVAAGRNLYGLSRGYRGPGSARTTYRGRQPIRNGDLANLVTDVLDLPRVPGSTFNRRQRLDAFR